MAAAVSRTLRLSISIRLCLASYTLSRTGPISSGTTYTRLVSSHAILGCCPLVVPLRHESHIHSRHWCNNVATDLSNTEPVESPADANTKKEQGSEESQKTNGTPKDVRGGPVSWLSFLLLLATGAGMIYYYDKEKKRHIEEIHNTANAIKEGPSAGKPAIGGPFNLINHDGKQVSERDFMGRWTLIYFGFTHCPDICPDELQKMVTAIDKIKEKARIDVLPVFISVDSERDTVEQVREYVKEFHPNLVGLTGNSEEIKKAARAYRVYYMRTSEDDDDYLVDHSIIMYLMAPDMEFVKFFGKNYCVDELTDSIIKEIKQYKK